MGSTLSGVHTAPGQNWLCENNMPWKESASLKPDFRSVSVIGNISIIKKYYCSPSNFGKQMEICHLPSAVDSKLIALTVS